MTLTAKNTQTELLVAMANIICTGCEDNPSLNLPWYQRAATAAYNAIINNPSSSTMRDAVAIAICAACNEQPYHVGDARGNAFRWQDYWAVADKVIAIMPDMALHEPVTQPEAPIITPPSLREQFEQQILASGQFGEASHDLLFSTAENGTYENPVIHAMWIGYQMPKADMPLYDMFDKAVARLLIISNKELDAELAPFQEHDNFADREWRIHMLRKYR